MSVLTHDPCRTVWNALEQAGCDPRGDIWKARAKCPAHNGEDRNLTLSEGADRRALLTCFSHRCAVEAIVRALGLSMSDLFPPGHRRARRPAAMARRQPSPVEVLLAAVREAGLQYRCSADDGMWVVECCPVCRRAQLWLHERGRDKGVTVTCLGGCSCIDVLRILAGVEASS